jgi:hypothetical protein
MAADTDIENVAIESLSRRVRAMRLRVGVITLVLGLLTGIGMMRALVEALRVTPAFMLAIAFTIPFSAILFAGLTAAKWLIATRGPEWAADVAAEHKVDVRDLRSYLEHM